KVSLRRRMLTRFRLGFFTGPTSRKTEQFCRVVNKRVRDEQVCQIPPRGFIKNRVHFLSFFDIGFWQGPCKKNKQILSLMNLKEKYHGSEQVMTNESHKGVALIPALA
ncbi:MAG: hypothetical protein ACE1ZO_07285, partial [Nitrospirales bacterium]